ncbi:unnamed protein product, partial [Didymodactylos carnosus]
RHIRNFHAYTRCRIHKLVRSQFFYWFITVLVLLNTIVLASEHYQQPPALSYIQGGKFEKLFEIEEKPRNNFDSFWSALVTVFQILTGEDWNEVMYTGIRAHGGLNLWGTLACFYFIILFVCGKYIVLNVFLAIVVDNLAEAQKLTDAEEEEKKRKELDKEKKQEREVKTNDDMKINDQNGKVGSVGKQSGEASVNETEENLENKEENGTQNDENESEEQLEGENRETKKARFRITCHKICSHKWFDYFVFICILVSSISLGAEDPVDPESTRNMILNSCDYVFTAVFTVEICLKVISYGLILHKGSVCRNRFNILDILIVAVSLTSMVIKDSAMSVVKILRLLRVHRPLRGINRAKGLKGKFYSCNDKSMLTKADCKGDYLRKVDNKIYKSARKWENSKFHFDSVAQALLTLFTVATLEGWPVYALATFCFCAYHCLFNSLPSVLHMAVDSNKENYGPIYYHRPFVAIFFVAFIIVIAFFMVNVFVGFVIVTFVTSEQEYKNCELDKNQRKCVEFALKARPTKHYIPEKSQFKIWWIVHSSLFEYAILALIMINTVMSAMKYYKQRDTYTKALDYINIVFTAIFTFESLLKMAAFSLKNYFGDPWNVYDFVIAVGSLIDIIYSFVIH